MKYQELLNDVLESHSDGTPLTDSETVYLQFRETVEPGLFDTSFDVLPAKSAPFGYTDQTLRSHVLNGAAFAVRLNYGLQKIDPGAALDDTDLRRALALFTVHDLHKTPEAQERRATATERTDADKDITSSELSEYTAELHLEEFAPELDQTDYLAAALGTEEQSGRHRGATSRTYTRLRPWLRLMDAAASTSAPSDVNGLERRIKNVSSEVKLASHRLSDIKGVTTNFLTSAVAQYVEANTAAVPLVYFANGAAYLAPAGTNLRERLPEGDGLRDELTDEFIGTVRTNIKEASGLAETRQTLVDKLNYGFMEFSRPTYLLYGFDRADEALQADLTDRMSGDPTLYSQYQLGATAAYASGNISELPSDWRTGQAATVYVATVFKELFKPLEGGNTTAAIQSIADALGVSKVGQWLTELEDLTWKGAVGEQQIDALTTHMPVSVDDISDAAADGINLTYVNRFITPLALAYLADGADGCLTGMSTQGVLSRLSEQLTESFRSWNSRWDEHRGSDWDPDQPDDQKPEAFLTTKISTVRDAIEQYIADTVILFEQNVAGTSSTKSKLDEYSSQYQPHICLLCNSVLTGSGSKSDFETSQDTIGLSMRFSHLSEITAEGGEPDALACPTCELEMVVRNSVHGFQDEDAEYLFLAPDYFYAPADVAFQKAVRDYLFVSEGYNLFQVAQRLLGATPDDRSVATSELLSLLSPEDGAESFQNSLKNYDAAFDDVGSLGVFRLDPPRRDPGSADPVTRISRETLNLATATLFSWFTSSRVLLTSRSVPMVGFDEFNQMVRAVDLPAELRSLFTETISVSALSDLNRTVGRYDVRMLHSGEVPEQVTAPNAGDDAAIERNVADPTDNDREVTSSVVPYRLQPQTELELRLYQLAALLTVTFRVHGTEVQRLKSVVTAMQSPFPGATALLKGDDVHGDYDALNAANVLDTLTHSTMSNSIQTLADAGFAAVRPELEKDSNYNYERLFRVAREAVSDNMMQNASREELETIVTGQVMKAAARTETNEKYAKEAVKRDAAERFGEVFVNDILYGICDGDFYQLRRHENSLAAGYNAAIRRRQAESFAEETE